MKYLIIIVLVLVNINLFSNQIRTGGVNGEYWFVGEEVSVEYNNEKLSDNIEVLLWDATKSEFLKLIVISNENGNALCYLPNSIRAGNQFKIRIIEKENNKNYVQSNNFFSIEKNRTEQDLKEIENISPNIAYPNPNNGILNLNLDKELTQIRMFNINGEEVIPNKIDYKQKQINIHNLQSGFYLLKCKTNDEEVAIKILKQ